MKLYKNITLTLLSTSLIFFSCKKEEENEENNNNNGTTDNTTVVEEEPDRDFYFKATIGNSTIEYKEGVDDFTSLMSYQSSGTYGDKYVGQNFGMGRDISNPPGAFAGIIKYFGPNNAEETCDEFKAMFKVGSYSYGSTNNEQEGAKVFYYNDAGEYWSSDLGAGNETGSTFNITEHEEVGGVGYEAITKATFDCWLYNDNGDSLRADGEIRTVTVQCF